VNHDSRLLEPTGEVGDTGGEEFCSIETRDWTVEEDALLLLRFTLSVLICDL
jgi:hypothetical protein